MEGGRLLSSIARADINVELLDAAAAACARTMPGNFGTREAADVDAMLLLDCVCRAAAGPVFDLAAVLCVRC